MKRILKSLIVFLLLVFISVPAFSATYKADPTARCIRMYGGTGGSDCDGTGCDYEPVTNTLSVWESDTDVDLSSLTTVDQDSSSGQPTLYVAATQVWGSDSFQADDVVTIDPGGTREETKTIQSVSAGVSITFTANLTYTHTAAQADSVASSAILECYDDQATFDDEVQISGATNTDANFRRIIRPASGEGHDGTPNNGFTISSTATAHTIDVRENYVQIQDIVAASNHSSTTSYSVFLAYNCDEAGFVGCIAFDSINTGAGHMKGFNLDPNNAANDVYAINCLAHHLGDTDASGSGDEGEGFSANAPSGDAFFYNCTSTYNNVGFRKREAVTATAKNCVSSHNKTSAWYEDSGSFTKTTCTDEYINTRFVDNAANDLHIAITDLICKDKGTDLSGDSLYPFDDDIDGETRTGTWDIGFDEEQATAPTTVTHIVDTNGAASPDYTSLNAWATAQERDLPAMQKANTSNHSGTFVVGESLSFSDSGATGEMIETDDSSWMRYSVSTGTPNTNDTISGATASCDIDSFAYQNGEIALATCRASSGVADTIIPGILGWDTDGNCYIKMWTDPAETYRHEGTYPTGNKYRIDQTSSEHRPTESYITYEGLAIHNSASGVVAAFRWDNWDEEGETIFSYNIVRKTVSGRGTAQHGVCHTWRVWNTLIYDAVSMGMDIRWGWHHMYNVTIVDSGTDGVYAATAIGTFDLRNVLVDNSGTEDFDIAGHTGIFNINYSASDDATANDQGGTGNRENCSGFNFVSPGTDDFHLQSPEADAIDVGDATLAWFSDDVDGDSRPQGSAWDIGFDEVTVAVGVVPVFMHHYRQLREGM